MRSHKIALRYYYPQFIAEEMEGQIAYLICSRSRSFWLLELGPDPPRVFPGLLSGRAGTGKETLRRECEPKRNLE